MQNIRWRFSVKAITVFVDSQRKYVMEETTQSRTSGMQSYRYRQVMESRKSESTEHAEAMNSKIEFCYR